MPKISLKQIAISTITFFIHTYFLNWKIALLITIGIGFHEYCHLLAAHRIKMETRGFVLLPFVGGISFVGDEYKSYSQQAFVAFAGPFGGGLLAIFLSWIYLLTKISWLAPAIYWMLLVNLFNLLPLSLLDGGLIMSAITYSINKKLGVVVLCISTLVAIVVITMFNPLVGILIAIFGGWKASTEIMNWKYANKNELWKCSTSWNNPSTAMTRREIYLMIFNWLCLFVGLFASIKMMHRFPESDLILLMTK